MIDRRRNPTRTGPSSLSSLASGPRCAIAVERGGVVPARIGSANEAAHRCCPRASRLPNARHFRELMRASQRALGRRFRRGGLCYAAFPPRADLLVSVDASQDRSRQHCSGLSRR